jgi:hypothetical protein
VALVRKRTIPTDRPPLVGNLSANFCGRGCCVVSATNSHGVNLGFLDQSRYFFIQVAPQLSSRGWVHPVPDPLLLKKSGRAGNRTHDIRICIQKLWSLNHRGGLQSPSPPIYLKSMLILFFHLRSGLTNRLFPSCFRLEFCTLFLCFPWRNAVV